ncbi:VCBS repeat-containing protein [Dyadobacter tibetensis]|uniref:VCBS repeat-containing protein n=1 Tax=Dyadobacter tibetensis TaxID=1211851 RepID=UPI00046F23AC|nr:VCBS repeat-containing protein [Dyadobacter tibetensis]
MTSTKALTTPLTAARIWFRSSFFFIAIILIMGCEQKQESLLKRHEASKLGIPFKNNILENDTLNYYSFPYLYMGGGVAVGDFNNDGLEDVFFTGNMTPNKLYLNRGARDGLPFTFEDITDQAGLAGDDRWYAGVTVVDINADGWLDLYLSVSGKYGSTENQLFVNNQNNTFSEKAAEYGLADASHSIQATFFDYDQDGLLDVFVGNYPIINVSMGNTYYRDKIKENRYEESGHLYRNQGNGHFEDVTTEAGLQRFGLTLGVLAQDFNGDGLTDLYLSNDFNVPDYFYLNQGDGTFSEVLQHSFRQNSQFGMGVDASDFNNDGLMDLVQVDMTPMDYKRAKTNMASMSPQTFYQGIDFGFHYQYMQNSLQLNQGNDTNGHPVFGNVARLAGVATTDWSWGVLFADFDMDGNKDIVVTNGMKRDVNNNDMNEQFQSRSFFEKNEDYNYEDLPSTPLDNFIFKNEGDFQFSDRTKEWGFEYKGFSNGIAYADFDGDGDLDMVINNIDDFASIYENTAEKGDNRSIRLRLQGPRNNPLGIDSKVQIVLSDERIITEQLTLSRGFQSSLSPLMNIGYGASASIKSVRITWPDGKITEVTNDISEKDILVIAYDKAKTMKIANHKKSHFDEISEALGLNFLHQEDSFDDFENEPLLPHRNSRLGPALAMGDVNGDGLEDLFVGNGSGFKARLYLQQPNGKFEVMTGPWEDDVNLEDTGALFLDIDGDNDLDLYVVRGGNDPSQPKDFYQDRLFVQTAEGFVPVPLPNMPSSGQIVRAADYNGDGRLDLFVAGRLVPGNYPSSPESYLLKNMGGKNQAVQFTKDQSIPPELSKAGLVTAAEWCDIDQDGQLDLVTAGEWSPIQIWKNSQGKFSEVTESYGLMDTHGWWYSLKVADIDQDGDMDLIAGNLGLNYKYHASQESPFEIYANDFDENGKQDIVLSYEKKGRRLPLRGRQCSTQQVPAIGKRFETYASFADASLEDIYGKKMLDASLHLKAYTFTSVWMENDGKGQFIIHPMARVGQISSINQIVAIDYNGDPFPDFILAGNQYQSEVETPRNDAGTGLIALGGPEGIADYVTAQHSGLLLNGDIRGMGLIRLGPSPSRNALVVAGNQERLKVFKLK